MRVGFRPTAVVAVAHARHAQPAPRVQPARARLLRALRDGAAFRYRRETGGGLAGAAAGLVFSFTPFRLNSPLWPQVLCTFAMPLAVAAWARWVRDGRGRDLAAWIGWWVVHSLMGMYVTFYFAVVMAMLALAAIAWAPVRDRARLARGTFVAALATGALLAPTLWPYVVLRQTQGHVRTAGFGTNWTFLLPGPGAGEVLHPNGGEIING